MSIHEECGVFGVYDPAGDCARTAYYGLYALQHRGQEACGIAAINDRELSFHKDLGLVGFDDISLLNSIGYELTVMDRPMQEMGEIAFGLLTDRMKGPAAKKRRREVMLRTRLIIRGSEKRQGVQEAVL